MAEQELRREKHDMCRSSRTYDFAGLWEEKVQNYYRENILLKRRCYSRELFLLQ